MTAEPISGLDPDRAVRQFFQDPEWKLKAGIGSMLSAIALIFATSGKLFLPLLPLTLIISSALQGYMLRVVRSYIKDPAGKLPPWNDWLDMLMSGLIWLSVLCTQIVVLIAIAVISLLYASEHNYLEAISTSFLYWAYITLLAMAFVLLLISFFLPLLMANFAEQEKISAVLGAKEAVRRLSNQPLAFLCAWLLGLGIYWLSIVVPLLTVIGVFFIPLTSFLAQVINTIMLAQVWREAGKTDR
jgi:hypothetical protein